MTKARKESLLEKLDEVGGQIDDYIGYILPDYHTRIENDVYNKLVEKADRICFKLSIHNLT